MKCTKLISLGICLLIFASCGIWGAGNYMPQPEATVYVPTGSYLNNQNKAVSLSAYWMSTTEVTNKEYREFVYAKSDTNKWIPAEEVLKRDLWISAYYDYLRDPMFDNFPVVGLTKAQMEAYAKWLTDQYNELYPGWNFSFRLPSVDEWRYAAYAGRSEQNAFPWGGRKDKNSAGCYLLHHFGLDEQLMVFPNDTTFYEVLNTQTISDTLIKSMATTIAECTVGRKRNKRKGLGRALPLVGLPVYADAYFPNDFGLYGLSGNVAEMTAEGEVLGGSFRTSSDYCKIVSEKAYPFDGTQAQVDIGFRLVCSYERPEVD